MFLPGQHLTLLPERETTMKQVAQNYRSGELAVLDVPSPACAPGGVLVRSLYSLISTGTELMKVGEARLSLVGKARARPDQVKKVLDSVVQQGAVSTYKKVMNKLDSYTPLGYSLCGVVTEVGKGAEAFKVGQIVACAGNEQALRDFCAQRLPPSCVPARLVVVDALPRAGQGKLEPSAEGVPAQRGDERLFEIPSPLPDRPQVVGL